MNKGLLRRGEERDKEGEGYYLTWVGKEVNAVSKKGRKGRKGSFLMRSERPRSPIRPVHRGKKIGTRVSLR